MTLSELANKALEERLFITAKRKSWESSGVMVAAEWRVEIDPDFGDVLVQSIMHVDNEGVSSIHDLAADDWYIAPDNNDFRLSAGQQKQKEQNKQNEHI